MFRMLWNSAITGALESVQQGSLKIILNIPSLDIADKSALRLGSHQERNVSFLENVLIQFSLTETSTTSGISL